MLTAVLAGVTAGSLFIAMACARRLYQWEKQLNGARLIIAYNGKNKLTPRLIDLLRWANSLQGDKRVNGHTLYKERGTAVAIVKPTPRQHGKTVTKTIPGRGK